MIGNNWNIDENCECKFPSDYLCDFEIKDSDKA